MGKSEREDGSRGRGRRRVGGEGKTKQGYEKEGEEGEKDGGEGEKEGEEGEKEGGEGEKEGGEGERRSEGGGGGGGGGGGERTEIEMVVSEGVYSVGLHIQDQLEESVASNSSVSLKVPVPLDLKEHWTLDHPDHGVVASHSSGQTLCLLEET
ncbi:hypothetical protein Pmani_029084 [Petrolisthes manimaculis]|uniref:Uncharacterized protein n=1 Tax=Petrolisthes manimaculis TaxID=1843537 RepID=A0AAE1TXC9_9EUCA|nr:hypothetical protein Pmani_029084 [Petrolisthes manimaculis]